MAVDPWGIPPGRTHLVEITPSEMKVHKTLFGCYKHR